MNSYRTRQIDELDALRSMYPEGDVEVCNVDVEADIRASLDCPTAGITTQELCVTIKVPQAVRNAVGRHC